MNINGKTITITGVLAFCGATIGVLSYMQVGWADIAWTTQARHKDDMATIRAEISTDAETIAFRTEWRCSEWAEDLSDLYEQQASGDDSQQLTDKIASLRERMDKAGCDKYEDY